MADALVLVGDRWSLHVVREIGMGVRRFDAIQRRTGAPREMLASRLRKLESTGVITRAPYSERPLRFEYALTAAGEELIPVMAALQAWGEKHATPRSAEEQTSAQAAGIAE
jgi:DNA-binding HxlR family transcriptional regulator